MVVVLPVIPYPAINPVLISIGPFAVRWYALAYIVGIIAGWFYARAIIASRAAVGRAGAAHRARLRRFRHLDHARHHSRRPHRLCAVLQSAAVRRASGPDFRTLERRHVVSRRRHRLHQSPSSLFALAAAHSDAVARRRRPPAVAPIGLFLGRLANFINGELWGRPTDVPWAMVFPNGGPIPRHPSQLYEAALGGDRALHRARARWCASARSSGPVSSPAHFALGYGIARIDLRILPRARRAARLSLGRHG